MEDFVPLDRRQDFTDAMHDARTYSRKVGGQTQGFLILGFYAHIPTPSLCYKHPPPHPLLK